MLRLLSLLSLVLGSYSGLAPFITPCKPGDSACLTSSTKTAIAAFADGVPSLGIASIDPMKIPLIHSDNAGLKLTFKNTTLTGLKDCTLEYIKHDAAKQKYSFSLKCNVVLTGNYILDGKLLILAVNGRGPFSINLRDIVIKVFLNLGTATGEDGLPHWKIVKWHHTYKVLTSVKFDFKDLFGGNKSLGDPVLDFANTQWRDVMQEVAPPVVEAVVTEMVKPIAKLFDAVPISELTLQ